jgi:heme-degrading monooxygenase HmoA
MFKLLIKFSVKDFDEWQRVFNENVDMRVRAGVKSTQVFRGVDDMKVVTVITEWEDPEKAKAFSQSAELRESQQHAGVVSKPEAYILQSM